MNFTIPFQLLTKNDLAAAGGKGANLGEMTTAGFPIPSGFVLTTKAYDAFVNANDLQPAIIDLVDGLSFDDPEAVDAASKQIREIFAASQIPEYILAELLNAYVDMGEDSVAVRSSATAEDLPEASFAGQLDSYLNIQGKEALLDAVRNCWASLWTARAITYRMKQGMDHSSLSLAVVVQQFVPADSAGILFTADPLSGERDQIVINASWGLGEAIVAGKVTPDTVVLNKIDHKILTRQTVEKSIMTVPIEDGVEDQPVPHNQQVQASLDDASAIELAKLGTQIEAHYEQPMDIEWAVASGSIVILQARPITSLAPAPLKDVRWDPPRPGTIWMRRQVVEHMPEPLSPLFDELYLQEGLDHSMESLTVFMSEISGIEIRLWDFIDPPFAASVNGYAYSISSFNFSPQMVPKALQIYITVLPKMIKHLMPRWENESLPGYLTVIEKWKGINLASILDDEIIRGIRKLAYADAIYWFEAAVPLGLARISDSALGFFLKVVMKDQNLTSGVFLRGFPSKTVEAQAHLESIARRIHDIDPLRTKVLHAPASELSEVLAQDPEVLAAFQGYLDAYGHQIYNLDFAIPTLADDPLPVLLSLKTAVSHPERDVRDQQAKLSAERDNLVASTEKSLNPFLRPIFKRFLGWAQRYSPNREVALFYVGAAWPALRRLALELGRRLTEVGSLDAPDDVFYLKTTELAEASTARVEGKSRSDLARLARERRQLREARKRLEPPVSVPPDGRMKFGPIDMAMFEPKPRSISTGPTLDGFAVSPGSVTALASVIRSPEDFDKMVPDRILVCTSTTPAWTPLFAQASGLVTDIGGALAHGSIVAREYGIPAVMGTGVATQRIKDGEMIRVDGNRGRVILVDKFDPNEYQRLEAQRIAQKQAAGRKKKAVLALVSAGLVLVWWWKKRR